MLVYQQLYNHHFPSLSAHLSYHIIPIPQPFSSGISEVFSPMSFSRHWKSNSVSLGKMGKAAGVMLPNGINKEITSQKRFKHDKNHQNTGNNRIKTYNIYLNHEWRIILDAYMSWKIVTPHQYKTPLRVDETPVQMVNASFGRGTAWFIMGLTLR